MVRLQKWLAQAGIASRRQCENLIESGYVRVNGEVICKLGTQIDPFEDIVHVQGKEVMREKKRTFLFHKPLGVISSLADPQGRKVVPDFFSDVKERIYPVGRLDYDTQGLLLVTNDGDLANFLMHPRYKIKKTYVALVRGLPAKEKLEILSRGIYLKDGLTAPAKVKSLFLNEKKSKIEITIHEGRNRQVRRMFSHIGHGVLHLSRVGYSFLSLGGLKAGQYRELSQEEVQRLREGGGES